MFEDFLAQMISSVYRRPRLLLHAVIVFMILVLLKYYAGVYLPLNIAKILGLEAASWRREAFVTMDLAITVVAIFTYLVLVVVLLFIINRALSKALENLDLSDPSKAIGKVRSSCFVDDVLSYGKGRKRGKLSSLMILPVISMVIALSYYTSIAFLLYAINDLLSLADTPILSILTSSGHITLFTVVTLIFGAAIVVLKMYLQQGLNTDSDSEKNIFEEWLENLIYDYLLENCTGKRGSIILASLAPLTPKYRPPLRYSTLIIPKELARSRFEYLVKEQYSIACSAKTSSEKDEKSDLKKFSECIERAVGIESFKEGLLKNLCVANLYTKTDKGEKYIGIIVAFTIPFISLQKPPLRLISDHRALVRTSSEEYYTYIALLAIDPSVAEFITRLVTG